MRSDLILKYFPNLTPQQISRFEQLYELYEQWNAKINVISRKDFEQLYLHHILHSLAIAKVCDFTDGARVLDVGCGGGFPSVPLAILYPGVEFASVDSIGKKIMVVRGVAEALALDNITPMNGRVEQMGGRFDYVVSRAVTDMSTFINWVWTKIERGSMGSLANGVLCLKGGELAEELALTGKKCTLYNIPDFFEEDFFDTKKVVYIRKS